MKKILHNIYDKKVLREKIAHDETPRTTFSFYRYVILEDAPALRDELYEKFSELNCLGRIYLAYEGINAQMSVPSESYKAFLELLYSYEYFKNTPIKIAVENKNDSFYKLIIKVKTKIVADGLDDNSFDVTNVGTHLSAREFNEALDQEGTIVVDMRNHYESEIGHFRGAICPDVDTFREELPLVLDELKDKKDHKLLLYCTGGVRCEKASAYFKHHGFQDVNQLLGGIIDYTNQVKAEGLESKFIGKNFVFDERLGERITDDVLAHCHQCGKACDTHTNCANDDCHLLFIQCDDCKAAYQGCCSDTCKDIVLLPLEDQRKLRKGKQKQDTHAVHHKSKGRLRPRPTLASNLNQQ